MSDNMFRRQIQAKRTPFRPLDTNRSVLRTGNQSSLNVPEKDVTGTSFFGTRCSSAVRTDLCTTDNFGLLSTENPEVGDSETQPPPGYRSFEILQGLDGVENAISSTPVMPSTGRRGGAECERTSADSPHCRFPEYHEAGSESEIPPEISTRSIPAVADVSALATAFGLSPQQMRSLILLAKDVHAVPGASHSQETDSRMATSQIHSQIPVEADTFVPNTEYDMVAVAEHEQAICEENEMDPIYDSFEDEVAAIQLKSRRVVDPLMDDVEPLLRPGAVTVPGNNSRYKKGLTVLDNGVPCETELFRQVLKASMKRCMPDSSKRWSDQSNREGVCAVIAEIESEFGRGFSRKWLRKQMSKLQANRRAYHRRLAAAQRRPDHVPEDVYRAHVQYLAKKQPMDTEQQRKARQKQYRTSKLGSGGLASLKNKVVDLFGFVPDDSLVEYAKRHGPSKVIKALQQRGYPKREKKVSVHEILVKNVTRDPNFRGTQLPRTTSAVSALGQDLRPSY